MQASSWDGLAISVKKYLILYREAVRKDPRAYEGTVTAESFNAPCHWGPASLGSTLYWAYCSTATDAEWIQSQTLHVCQKASMPHANGDSSQLAGFALR